MTFAEELRGAYPWMPRALAPPLRPHSTARAPSASSAARPRSRASAGISAAQLYEAEVRYLVANEWAQTPEDVLHRRTKQELHMTEDERAAFAAWFDAELAPQAA